MSRSVSNEAVLPSDWPKRVRSGVINAISLAHVVLTSSRAWAANHWNSRFRLKIENQRLRQEVALLEAERRLKDSRLARIPAHERPHYSPIERMGILELRAARAWSLKQTADRLLVATATVSSWMRRVNEAGPAAMVQIPEPVNKFPELVAYTVQRFKLLCPSLGYKKIAQFLCRAGLHLGATTVRRMLRGQPAPKAVRGRRKAGGRPLVARYPNHVWGCDLTAVPTSFGFWTAASPFTLPQRWPFCWWVAIVADQRSRRIMGFAIFPQLPTAEAVVAFLARAIANANAAPRHIVTDKGPQFRSDAFQAWCKRRGIRPRFGALGQFGSIALIERLILTIKDECTRRLLVPYTKAGLRTELSLFCDWYNRERPHEWLAAATPDETYGGVAPGCVHPRFEPRRNWPRRSPCAAPRVSIHGRRGVRVQLHVSYLSGRKHLPIVRLERAA